MKKIILITVVFLLFGCSSRISKNTEENIQESINEMVQKYNDLFTFRIAETKDVFGDNTGKKTIQICIYGECNEFGNSEDVIITLACSNKTIGIFAIGSSLKQKYAIETYKIQYKTNNGTKKIAYATPINSEWWQITDTRQGQSSVEFLNCLLYSEKIQVYMEGEKFPMNNYRFDIDTKNFKSLYDTLK